MWNFVIFKNEGCLVVIVEVGGRHVSWLIEVRKSCTLVIWEWRGHMNYYIYKARGHVVYLIKIKKKDVDSKD